MKEKFSLRLGLLVPLIAVISLLTSFVFATEAMAATKSITYNANGATSGVVPTGGTYTVGSNYTVLGNIGSPPLANTGLTFAGWNTLANGTGVTYQPGSIYVVPNAATIFYARWRVAITYDGNSPSGGSAPVDPSSPYASNATVTVLGNTGFLTKLNMAFSGWNTATDGNGTNYSPGSTFSATANLILYAKWTPTYTVLYSDNASTGGTVPVDSSSPYISGSSVTVLGNTGALVKDGSTFSNWNTSADGTGTTYAPTSTFTITGNTTLHALWRSTLTYNANGATGGTAPTDAASPYLTGATVTVLGSGTLSKSEHTFAGWNTAANGSGTPYAPGNTFTIPGNTTLYAQWSILTYTVTYNGNGSTSGSPPVDGSSPYSSGATVTVLGNTGPLVRLGYVFSHWNTAANDSGTSYSPTSTFVIGTNTVLYAQWVSGYTVTYNGNGKTSGSSPTLDPVTYSVGATVTVLGNIGSLARTGNTFSDWNTAANGSGAQYVGGDTFVINANVILYAQWRATVTYDANGSTGGGIPVDGSSPYLNGATVTVLGNTNGLVKTGYLFVNWNTQANGGGTPYNPGNSFAILAHTTLYAQWSPSYTVTYDGNGSSGGSMPVDGNSPYLSGATVTVLGNTGPLAKTGNAFSSWNTSADGLGTSYSPGTTFVISTNTILYAQWVLAAPVTVTYSGNGSTGGTVPVDSSSPYANGSSVTVLGNTGSLVKTGYSFSNWNTAANGSGTSYVPGNTFIASINTVLYAQWMTLTYSVTYNSNGATSGTVPVDASSPYVHDATVTILSNSGSLGKIGAIFAGWNTLTDGSGAAYSPAATFTITANTILYAQWTAIYTVIYRPAGSTGGSVPVDGASPYTTGSTVTVLGNTGSLVRTGTTFDNWNTAVDGSGASYSVGGTFIIHSDTLLFAQWRSTLIYNSNGATGGTVPVNGNSPYLTPYINSPAVTVLGNTGSLVKLDTNGDDYHPFAGWNTSADGTGTSYSPGDQFILTGNVTLYAQWTPIRHTITYNRNAATSGVVPVDASSPYLEGSTVTVKGNTGVLVKTGYIFSHWNTAADGSGISYAQGATFVIDADTVLYPEWIAIYTVIYDEDGATGGTAPVDGSSPYQAGASVTVLGNSGSLVRTGNAFSGWNTVENGSGISYAQGVTFTASQNVILYAQWTATVTYNGDGATGGTVPIDASSPYPNPYGGRTVVTVLGNPGSLVRTGYTFTHWGTGPNNTGEHFNPGDEFILEQNTVLYAHWEVVGTHSVVYNDNGATGGTVPVDANNPYTSGATATVLGNTGLLVKTGSVFVGWNTSADGSGTSYQGGNTFSIQAATVLYAQWANNSFAVLYNGNGATSGSVPIDAHSPYGMGNTVTILSNSGGLSKADFNFEGWNTAADGSGTTYDATGSETFEIDSATTFYAVWSHNHTVTFNGNSADAGSMSPQISDATTALSVNIFSRSGYVFRKWNTVANGTGIPYANGALYDFAADVTLYAQWSSVGQPYTPPAITSPLATISAPIS